MIEPVRFHRNRSSHGSQRTCREWMLLAAFWGLVLSARAATVSAMVNDNARLVSLESNLTTLDRIGSNPPKASEVPPQPPTQLDQAAPIAASEVNLQSTQPPISTAPQPTFDAVKASNTTVKSSTKEDQPTYVWVVAIGGIAMTVATICVVSLKRRLYMAYTDRDYETHSRRLQSKCTISMYCMGARHCSELYIGAQVKGGDDHVPSSGMYAANELPVAIDHSNETDDRRSTLASCAMLGASCSTIQSSFSEFNSFHSPQTREGP